MEKLPLDLYPREMKRISPEEVKASNFSVAKEFADYISSTFGPQSAQKAIVSSDSNYYTISSDGKTILQRFDLVEFKAKHPVAQLMVELAKSTDDEVGDGTTSSVILAGELLKGAEKLIDQGLHPTIVANGFRNATDMATKLLEDLAKPVDTDEMLLKVARTSLDTKYISALPEKKEGLESLANMVVEAIKIVADDEGRANPDDVHIVKKSGGNIFDTTVFSGDILEKEMLHPSMPKSLKDARIAVIDTPLMVTRYDGLFAENKQVSVKASGFTQYRSQKSGEKEMLLKMVQKIIDAGANVIISRKFIDERLGKPLADKGIIAIPTIPTREDLSMVAGACGATIVSDLDMISPTPRAQNRDDREISYQ
ncbi:MAG: TCP-1/cpn60 chaperonin family protein, partial [Halobacteriota archaeon]|nr:TCP-1/cpn60 chaperonin family protein [Halobacteriota archaeon]